VFSGFMMNAWASATIVASSGRRRVLRGASWLGIPSSCDSERCLRWRCGGESDRRESPCRSRCVLVAGGTWDRITRPSRPTRRRDGARAVMMLALGALFLSRSSEYEHRSSRCSLGGSRRELDGAPSGGWAWARMHRSGGRALPATDALIDCPRSCRGQRRTDVLTRCASSLSSRWRPL